MPKNQTLHDYIMNKLSHISKQRGIPIEALSPSYVDYDSLMIKVIYQALQRYPIIISQAVEIRNELFSSLFYEDRLFNKFDPTRKSKNGKVTTFYSFFVMVVKQKAILLAQRMLCHGENRSVVPPLWGYRDNHLVSEGYVPLESISFVTADRHSDILRQLILEEEVAQTQQLSEKLFPQGTKKRLIYDLLSNGDHKPKEIATELGIPTHQVSQVRKQLRASYHHAYA